MEYWLPENDWLATIESSCLCLLSVFLCYNLTTYIFYGKRNWERSLQVMQYETDENGITPWDKNSKTLDLSSLSDAHVQKSFNCINDVQTALRKGGLISCSCIFGIDFTASNKHQGQKTFQGRNLHSLDSDELNPYQQVILTIGETLDVFNQSKKTLAYGFGDEVTRGHSVFPLNKKQNCKGYKDVFDTYNRVVKKVSLSGPTNFAPLIYKALSVVKETKKYHVLIIIADGQIINERDTKEAIEKASFWPLSIIMIGVGDGPWNLMKEFCQELPARSFENFQFVNYHKQAKCSEIYFAIKTLMSIPDQFMTVKKKGLLERDYYKTHTYTYNNDRV